MTVLLFQLNCIESYLKVFFSHVHARNVPQEIVTAIELVCHVASTVDVGNRITIFKGLYVKIQWLYLYGDYY